MNQMCIRDSDNPAVVCDFTSGGQAYTLTLSDTDADGNRYLIYSGIDAVFQIANSKMCIRDR